MVKKIKRRVGGGRPAAGEQAPPPRFHGLSGQAVPPPADVEGARLELTCGACGDVGEYAVGTLMLTREASFRSIRHLGDHWGFTGDARCRKCGAGDAWRLTDRSFADLVELALQATLAPSRARVKYGEMRLFDGTVTRFGAQAVAHLEALIAAKPDDPFLRDRLGNAYRVGGRPELAIAAWKAAIALDPGHMPSLYSVGDLLVDAGRPDEGLPYLHRCMLAARTSPLPHGTKRELVLGALDASMAAFRKSGGRTRLLPAGAAVPEPLDVASLGLRDRDRLADLLLK